MSRLTDRERVVWDKRNSGLTFKQIAEELGLCPATVSFAYRKAERKVEYENDRERYRVMERLTEKDNFEKHLGDGMHCDYVKFPDGKCAIYNKLTEYESTGLEPSEIEKLKHDLEVRDRALELSLISRKEMLEKQNCFTYSVEKAKIGFLDQAEKELKERK